MRMVALWEDVIRQHQKPYENAPHRVVTVVAYIQNSTVPVHYKGVPEEKQVSKHHPKPKHTLSHLSVTTLYQFTSQLVRNGIWCHRRVKARQDMGMLTIFADFVSPRLAAALISAFTFASSLSMAALRCRSVL